MKIIDVLIKLANGDVEKGTKLRLEECSFNFGGDSFTNEQFPLGNSIFLSTRFLNEEVELIPPKEKKYLVKLHIKGLLNIRNYLNYYNDGIKQWIELGNDLVQGFYQTRFTKQEMQDIQPVREFLEDMEGKYELIEVKDNEDDWCIDKVS